MDKEESTHEATENTEVIAQDEAIEAPDATEETKKVQGDVFLWANQTDGVKNDLDIDLYLFTKGYTVYATNYAKELLQQLKVLFLYDMVSEVQTGAATGLTVRDFEAAEREENVLQRTDLDKVEHAQEVIEQIVYGEEGLEIFSEGDHEFKKVKGVIARFKPKDAKKDDKTGQFFVVKLLPQTQVLKGATAWMFDSGSFQPFAADAGLRITPDNQVLIDGEDVYVFSETKFVRLFGYDAKQFAIAEEKIKEIEEHFKLSFPEGLSLDALVKDKRSLVTKLQKVDPTLVTQEQLMEYNDEIGIGLMSDEATGAIIIMDANDATKFVNLLNDDYVTSEMTGLKYELKGKKVFADDQQGEGGEAPGA